MRVACCQLAPAVGAGAENLRATVAAIDTAAAGGAEVVVLPELAASGYAFSGEAEARAHAEPLDGPTLSAWREASRRAGVVVVGGFAEGDPAGAEAPFNSAAVIDGGELLAVHRKLHLWDEEQSCFRHGAAPAPVVTTSRGRIGVAVCYDLEFPEVARGLTLAGAELLALPTNWPRTQPPAGERPMLRTLAMATARLNRVFVALCDRAGDDRALSFEGGSAIVGPDGWPLVEAPLELPAEIAADCDLALARDKRLGARNDVLADRRPDHYRLDR